MDDTGNGTGGYSWRLQYMLTMCKETVQRMADDNFLGGNVGACVCWWHMPTSCWSWAHWLSETGQMGDTGDGWCKSLARSTAATMVALAEDLKGMTVLVGNHTSVSEMRSSLVAHTHIR
jgi:hypothetical protein